MRTMRPDRLCLIAAAAAMTVLVACGSTPAPVAVGAPPEQAIEATPGGEAAEGEDCGARNDGIDRTDKDGVTREATSFTADTADYMALTLEEGLAGYQAVSVMRVTDRDHPQVGRGRNAPGVAYRVSDAAAAVTADPDSPRGVGLHIARPVTFATDRAIKGDVGPCNTLMVPGGTATDGSGSVRAERTGPFPEKLEVGDRVLALWWAPRDDGPLVVALMSLVDAGGMAVLPFGDFTNGGNRLNVDTYQPSAVVLRAPAPRPAEPEAVEPEPDVEAEVDALLPALSAPASRGERRLHEEKRNELRQKLRDEAKAKGGTTTTRR